MAEEVDPIEAVRYQLGKSLDEAIYDAVANVIDRWNKFDDDPEKHLDRPRGWEPDEFADDSIQLPDGRIVFVSWTAEVRTKEEVFGPQPT